MFTLLNKETHIKLAYMDFFCEDKLQNAYDKEKKKDKIYFVYDKNVNE